VYLTSRPTKGHPSGTQAHPINLLLRSFDPLTSRINARDQRQLCLDEDNLVRRCRGSQFLKMTGEPTGVSAENVKSRRLEHADQALERGATDAAGGTCEDAYQPRVALRLCEAVVACADCSRCHHLLVFTGSGFGAKSIAGLCGCGELENKRRWSDKTDNAGRLLGPKQCMSQLAVFPLSVTMVARHAVET